MRRITIIGASGSGKSTLARTMGACLGLPVVHLDREYWRPGWIEPEKETWRARVAELVACDAWVMDGNYSATWDIRLPRTEAVVWLDLPRRVYFPRAVWRTLRGVGAQRPDIGEGCPERVNLAFLFDWVWNYPSRSRDATARRLAALHGEKRIVILRSPGEVARFVAGLPGALTTSWPDASP